MDTSKLRRPIHPMPEAITAALESAGLLDAYMGMRYTAKLPAAGDEPRNP